MQELDKLRELLLSDLIELTDIFDKIGVRYSLYGGTLLGALRGNGFCTGLDGSMDDDIDILIPIDDFKILNEYYESGGLPEYYLLSGFGIYDTRYELFNTNKLTRYLSIDIFYSLKLLKSDKLNHVLSSITDAVKAVTRSLVDSTTCKLSRDILIKLSNFLIERSFDNPVTGTINDIKYIPDYGDIIYADRTATFCGNTFRIIDNAESYLEVHYDDWRKVPKTCDRHGTRLLIK